MAERYGVRPKKFTKEWWPYFWTYYKWHTVAAAVAVLLILVTAVQCATQETYDLTITYAGSRVFIEKEVEALEAEAEKYVEDVDGNGENNVLLLQLNFGNNQSSAEMDYALQTKHDLEMNSSEISYLYIYDKEKAEQMVSRDDACDIYVNVNEWVDGDISEEKVLCNAGGIPAAVSLEDSTILKNIGINPDGLYAAVKVDFSDKEICAKAQKSAIAVANEILK